MDHKSPVKIYQILLFRGKKTMGTWVIEVTEFDYEVRCDLWGCLEAIMASEATKMAVRGNMHNDARVIKFADFKSEVKFKFWGHWGCFEAAMASEATKMAVRGNMYQGNWVCWFQFWGEIWILRPFWGNHGLATKMAILGIMHIHVDSKVMEVIEHHMPISHSPCRRRSKGPLPSGLESSL